MLPSWIVIGCLTGNGLGKFSLTPTLHSHKIQDSSLIRKCAIACPKYVPVIWRIFTLLLHYLKVHHLNETTLFVKFYCILNFTKEASGEKPTVMK